MIQNKRKPGVLCYLKTGRSAHINGILRRSVFIPRGTILLYVGTKQPDFDWYFHNFLDPNGNSINFGGSRFSIERWFRSGFIKKI